MCFINTFHFVLIYVIQYSLCIAPSTDCSSKGMQLGGGNCVLKIKPFTDATKYKDTTEHLIHLNNRNGSLIFSLFDGTNDSIRFKKGDITIF